MQSAEKNTNKIIEFLRDKNDDKKITEAQKMES